MDSIPPAERVQFRVYQKSGITTNRLQFHPPETQNHHLELQGGTQEATGAPREAQRALQKPFCTQCVAVLLIALIVAGRYADEWGSDFQEMRDDISKTYTDAEVKEIPDYEWINYDDAELKLTSGEETILKYIPEQWMIVGK